MLDIDRLIDGVHEYLGKAFMPVLARIKALEERAPVPGPQGENGIDGRAGIDGKDGAPGPAGEKGLPGTDGRDGERGPQGERGEQGPKGEKGEPGQKGDSGADGKDGAPGELGPQGAPGPQGEKGDPGLNGKDGTDGLNGKDGAPGRDGKDGADGMAGKDGAPGERGEKGADGTSVTVDQVMPLLEASVAKWMLDWERRAQETLAKAIERIPVPKDGAPGRDGFGPEDMEAKYHEETRTLAVSWKRGDAVETREFVLEGLPRDTGTFRPDREYQKGDGATYGGSYWIRLKSGFGAPPSDAWRLAVKGTR